MVLSQIIKVGATVFKYRRQIYSVITAQDRYIKSAFVGTRVSKSAQYGWRTGAAAGGLVGSLINIDDNNTNGGQKIQQRKPAKTRPTYQTRNRQSIRTSPRYPERCRTDRKYRRSNSRFY